MAFQCTVRLLALLSLLPPPGLCTIVRKEVDADGSADDLVNMVQLPSMPAVALRYRRQAEDLDEICRHPLPTHADKWNVMAAFANVLNGVGAPWNIHGGLLLGLARGCYIFDSDLDFAVDRQWLQKHHKKVEDAMLKEGFRQEDVLGDAKSQGYEEKFAAPDSLASTFFWESGALNARLVHNTSGVPIDLFAIERKHDHYEWLLWVSQTEAGKCVTTSTGTQPFSWLGVHVNIPVPVEDALTSAYGPRYMKKASWRWNREPFTIGSCRLQPAPKMLSAFPWWMPVNISTEMRDEIQHRVSSD